VGLRGALNRQTGNVRLTDRVPAGFLAPLGRQRVEVVVRMVRTPPTVRQRGYYFPVVVGRYAEYAGMTKAERHYALKREFLPLDNLESPMPNVASIKSLAPAQFVAYVHECVRLAAEMGCVIPSADPHWRLQRHLAEMARA
jgi:hypothetical protein